MRTSADEVAGLLPAADDVASALTTVIGHVPPRPHLLKVVGIDLDRVRSAVRQTFGDEAVEDLGRRRVHQPWQPWRRPSRTCTSLLAGTTIVALKQSLEQASRDAERRHLAAIDPAALLLGTIEVEKAVSNRLLRDLRVDPDQLRKELRALTG